MASKQILSLINKTHSIARNFIVNDLSIRKIFNSFSNVQKIRKYSTGDMCGPGKKEADKSGQTKGLVLGVWEDDSGKGPKLTPTAEKFNKQIGGKLTEALKQFQVSGKVGTNKVFCNLSPEFHYVAVVGAGKEGIGYCELEQLHIGRENVRAAVGLGTRKLKKNGCRNIYVDCMDYPAQAATGATLASFLFQGNRSIKKPKVQIYPYDLQSETDWERGLCAAEAQNTARHICGAPANHMTPTCFAEITNEILCPCGVMVQASTLPLLETKRLFSFLTVARSSCEQPVLLEISYCGAPENEKPIVIISDGITFNSGGINLKDRTAPSEFRCYIEGAAVAIATVRGAAQLSLPINLHAIIALCENMPSGMASRVGDVITTYNGKSLAIQDTENVGLVVMSDIICYVQQTYTPNILIDISSTTNGIRKTLGDGAAAVYSPSHYLWGQLQSAGSLVGDRLWRMPLWRYYKDKVSTHYDAFDVSNKGMGPARSCLSAAVINEFVKCADFAHIDIQGVATHMRSDMTPYLPKGQYTGRPTRTLIQFLYQMSCQSSEEPKDRYAL